MAKKTKLVNPLVLARKERKKKSKETVKEPAKVESKSQAPIHASENGRCPVCPKGKLVKASTAKQTILWCNECNSALPLLNRLTA